MGCCKQLLDLGGKTVIARCLEALLAGGVADVIVVVGIAGEAVAEAAARYPVRIAVNGDPAGDMASSVLAGRRQLAATAGGVIVSPGDYPLVEPDTISRLITAHGEEPGTIVIPCHGGRQGHPVLFPVACLDELATGGTLRDTVRRCPERVRRIDVADPGILLDMDTPEDYRSLLRVSSPDWAARAQRSPRWDR